MTFSGVALSFYGGIRLDAEGVELGMRTERAGRRLRLTTALCVSCVKRQVT